MKTEHNIDLHAVFTEVSDSNDYYLRKQGFHKNTIESEDIETKFVYTHKPEGFITKKEYRLLFEKTKDVIFNQNKDKGYLEMEEKQYNGRFSCELREYREIISPDTLQIHVPEMVIGDKFKASDIHFRADQIDPKLIEVLRNCGFYMARFTNKILEEGKEKHDVYTLQFADPRLAEITFQNTENLIRSNGGFVGNTQIEPTLRYYRTPNYPVPPCVY